jgi:hypothetical protein
MKVESKDRRRVAFDSLEPGDTFRLPDSALVFMKIGGNGVSHIHAVAILCDPDGGAPDQVERGVNAVRVCDGFPVSVSNEVVVVEGSFVEV